MENFLWEKERASIEFGLGWQEFSPSLWTFCCFGQFVQFGLVGAFKMHSHLKHIWL
jgi:hypothetical protein